MIAGYFGGWVDAFVSPLDGRLPRVPAAGLRDRAGGRHSRTRRSGCPATRCGSRCWSSSSASSTGPTSAGSSAARRCRCASASSSTRPAASGHAPVHPVPRAAAEPGGADPRLLDAADPDEHPVRGGAVLPRRRCPPPTPTWGGMLSDAVRISISRSTQSSCSCPVWRSSSPSWPSTCFGDGLRDALDPRTR